MVRYEMVFKALADRSRLRILALLFGGPRCVCEVVGVLGLAQPTVSQHLGILKRAGLIASEKHGRWVYYRLTTQSESPMAAEVSRPILERLSKDPQAVGDLRILACCEPAGPRSLASSGAAKKSPPIPTQERS